MQRGVHVHIAKQQMVLDGSLPSRITATVLGLAAEIEREFIALRAREALAKRRAEGKPLGRPKGKPAARLKLDAQEAVIRGYLAKGINKLAMARLLECAPSTLYTWLARRNLRPSRGTTRVQGPSVTP
jgi:DNA invertase Pin-like site-specific DNA recombinase